MSPTGVLLEHQSPPGLSLGLVIVPMNICFMIYDNQEFACSLPHILNDVAQGHDARAGVYKNCRSKQQTFHVELSESKSGLELIAKFRVLKTIKKNYIKKINQKYVA